MAETSTIVPGGAMAQAGGREPTNGVPKPGTAESGVDVFGFARGDSPALTDLGGTFEALPPDQRPQLPLPPLLPDNADRLARELRFWLVAFLDQVGGDPTRLSGQVVRRYGEAVNLLYGQPGSRNAGAEEAPHPGAVMVGGQWMIRNDKGGYDPLHTVRPQELLEDQTVRTILGYAIPLRDQIARFKGHTFDDVNTFLDILAGQYNAKRGGKKGNVSLSSYDQTMKVELRISDTIGFGPELQVARDLVDECVAEWTEGVNAELRALVDHAFAVDKEGRVNREALLKLRRLAIEHPTWKRAMQALTDSIRTQGSTVYMRFQQRQAPGADWETISIDLAAVRAPQAQEGPSHG